MGGMPLVEDAPAAFIFSRRQLLQRQPAAGASAEGMGMTCGSSAHQQPLSRLQVISALHWEQRVSTEKLWPEWGCASSARKFGALGRGRVSCQRGEAGAILDIRWRLAKHAGAVYFSLLQSLTGNSDS